MQMFPLQKYLNVRLSNRGASSFKLRGIVIKLLANNFLVTPCLNGKRFNGLYIFARDDHGNESVELLGVRYDWLVYKSETLILAGSSEQKRL
jgi:hypothetical protein